MSARLGEWNSKVCRQAPTSFQIYPVWSRHFQRNQSVVAASTVGTSCVAMPSTAAVIFTSYNMAVRATSMMVVRTG